MHNRSLLEDFLSTDSSETTFQPLLSPKETSLLSSTCKSFHLFYNELLLKLQAAHYVITVPNESNKKKLIAMLTANPTLVTTVIRQAKDNIGRIIKNKTLYQLAYGAGDADYCLAMKPAFIKLFCSEEAAIKEMEKQRNEIFDSEEIYKQKEAESKSQLEELLNPVKAAISAEQFNLGEYNKKIVLNPATLAAIKTFRIEFDRIQPMVIEKGMHFRDNTLLEAYKAYVQVAAEWNNNENRCALFEDGVLSFILSYVPENDAQKLSQGVVEYLKGAPSRRSSELRKGGENFYDVVCGPSDDFCDLVGTFITLGGSRGRPKLEFLDRVLSALSDYFNFKRTELMQVSRTTTPESSMCNVLQ